MPSDLLIVLIILCFISLFLNTIFVFVDYEIRTINWLFYIGTISILSILLLWYNIGINIPNEVSKIQSYKVYKVDNTDIILLDDRFINLNLVMGKSFNECDTIEATFYKNNLRAGIWFAPKPIGLSIKDSD